MNLINSVREFVLYIVYTFFSKLNCNFIDCKLINKTLGNCLIIVTVVLLSLFTQACGGGSGRSGESLNNDVQIEVDNGQIDDNEGTSDDKEQDINQNNNGNDNNGDNENDLNNDNTNNSNNSNNPPDSNNEDVSKPIIKPVPPVIIPGHGDTSSDGSTGGGENGIDNNINNDNVIDKNEQVTEEDIFDQSNKEDIGDKDFEGDISDDCSEGCYDNDKTDEDNDFVNDNESDLDSEVQRKIYQFNVHVEGINTEGIEICLDFNLDYDCDNFTGISSISNANRYITNQQGIAEIKIEEQLINSLINDKRIPASESNIYNLNSHVILSNNENTTLDNTTSYTETSDVKKSDNNINLVSNNINQKDIGKYIGFIATVKQNTSLVYKDQTFLVPNNIELYNFYSTNNILSPSAETIEDELGNIVKEINVDVSALTTIVTMYINHIQNETLDIKELSTNLDMGDTYTKDSSIGTLYERGDFLIMHSFSFGSCYQYDVNMFPDGEDSCGYIINNALYLNNFFKDRLRDSFNKSSYSIIYETTKLSEVLSFIKNNDICVNSNFSDTILENSLIATSRSRMLELNNMVEKADNENLNVKKECASSNILKNLLDSVYGYTFLQEPIKSNFDFESDLMEIKFNNKSTITTDGDILNDVEQWGNLESELSYYWSFGDGKTSSEKDVVHLYEKPGKYQVTLVATNDTYYSSSSKEVIVSVDTSKCVSYLKSKPKVNFVTIGKYVYANVLFWNTPYCNEFNGFDYKSLDYYFDFGDGIEIKGDSNLAAVYEYKEKSNEDNELSVGREFVNDNKNSDFELEDDYLNDEVIDESKILQPSKHILKLRVTNGSVSKTYDFEYEFDDVTYDFNSAYTAEIFPEVKVNTSNLVTKKSYKLMSRYMFKYKKALWLIKNADTEKIIAARGFNYESANQDVPFIYSSLDLNESSLKAELLIKDTVDEYTKNELIFTTNQYDDFYSSVPLIECYNTKNSEIACQYSQFIYNSNVIYKGVEAYVDWGDGTLIRKYSVNSEIKHTYTKDGKYKLTISFKPKGENENIISINRLIDVTKILQKV